MSPKPKPAQKGHRESNRKKANNGNHIETHCKWCDTKIARGMEYCNRECRSRNISWRRASTNTKQEQEDG